MQDPDWDGTIAYNRPNAVSDKLQRKVDALQADLAAARELLRKAIPHLVGNGHWDGVARIQAHLDLVDTKKNDPG